MKKHFITAFLLFSVFAVTGSVIAGAFIISFQVKSENDNIVVEWSTKDESELDYYAVERKTYRTEYVRLQEKIYPNGNNYYRFVDKSAYKTTDNVYTYRVAIVNKNGTVDHSGELAVVHQNVSGVKRTWGSIKAMFR
ncbi:MAG: hypothetical protein ACM3Q2_01270 [Syntrophothermus sp.]